MNYEKKARSLDQIITRTGFKLVRLEDDDYDEAIFCLRDVNGNSCPDVESRRFNENDVCYMIDSILCQYINDAICNGIGIIARLEGMPQEYTFHCRNWSYLIDHIEDYPSRVYEDICLIRDVYYDQDDMSLLDCEYEDERE